MANTIFAGYTAAFATDVFGPVQSSDHDLVQTYDNTLASGFGQPGDLINVPVNLAPLGNYGGPTQTMPLLPGSNGIDVGDTAATGKTTLPGLADLWKGEGNAHDSVGSQNGTVGGTVTYATGEVGKAFSFNGAGSVQFGAHAVGTSDFSLSFWLQTTNAGTQAVLGDRTTFGGGNFYGVRMNNGHLIVELDQDTSGTNYVGIVSNQTVNDGLFHQVSIVRSGTTVLLYIDGSLDSQGHSAATTNLNSTNPLIIAAETGNNFPDFVGKLDEIGFYNQALSGQQILAAYAGPVTQLTDQRGAARVVGGASATFTVTATVNTNNAVGTVLTNKVSISPTTDDSNTGNNKLSQRTTVVAPPATNVIIPTHQDMVLAALLSPNAKAESDVLQGSSMDQPVNSMPNLTDQTPSTAGIDAMKANALSFLVTGLKQGDDLPDSTKTLLGV